MCSPNSQRGESIRSQLRSLGPREREFNVVGVDPIDTGDDLAIVRDFYSPDLNLLADAINRAFKGLKECAADAVDRL